MIRIDNLTKTYNIGKRNETTAVKDFNLNINYGETVILSGVSGSGKSTILSLISGTMKPTNGVVRINDQIVSKLPDRFASTFRRGMIGMIFQQYNLVGDLSVIENISIPLLPTDLTQAQIKNRCKSILAKLDIADKGNLAVQNLSGGEMQRVAIARALINDPHIILADEPTANLDKALTQSLIEMLQKLKLEGKTIIIATHDPAILNSGIATRIIPIIKEG
ncbi:MAG: ABC transporter ATP-binding protein [Denitrovibrio sp.]|nr:MAG: ABC transporter ATP-binding protein [Denitrovibrio sp.]